MGDPRIDRIEAELAYLRQQLRGAPAPAVAPNPPQVRLAKVIEAEECSGHTEPALATVYIRFVDPVFADQSWAERQGSGAHAHAFYAAGWDVSLSGPVLSPGQIVTVIQANGYWWIVAPVAEVQFELKDALLPASNATAFLRSDGTTDESVEFEVYDVLGQYYGRAHDAYASPHEDGSCGSARFNPTSGHWEITDLTPYALMICGEARAEVLTTDGHFHVADGTLEVLHPHGGIILDQDPGDEASFAIDNRHGWKLDANAKFEAVFRKDGSGGETSYYWMCIQGDCPTS